MLDVHVSSLSTDLQRRRGGTVLADVEALFSPAGARPMAAMVGIRRAEGSAFEVRRDGETIPQVGGFGEDGTGSPDRSRVRPR